MSEAVIQKEIDEANQLLKMGTAIRILVKTAKETGLRRDQIPEIVKAIRDDLKDAIR